MNQDITNEIRLEQLWNNNKVHKVLGDLIKSYEWFPDFCKEHSQYSKTMWFRLLAILLLYKRLNITTLVGIFHKKEKDTGKLLEFFLYAESINVLIWDDENEQYYLNNLCVPDEIQEGLNQWQFPMPLITKPMKLISNNQSPYILVDDKNNVVTHGHHNLKDDINLDHINRLNSIQYEVNADTAINCINEWKPKKKDNEELVKRNFQRYTYYCMKAMELIYDFGNKFYFSWKYDKRGRCYPQGYFLNPQGTDYNKYCLQLVNKEIVK